MLDLEHELGALIDALNHDAIEYALCGGLALAVHGFVRASVDIDLLVREEDVPAITAAADRLGFDRLIKFDVHGDPLTIDLCVVTSAIENVWRERETLAWNGRSLTIVSRDGLIALKTRRAGRWDLSDITRMGPVDYSERAIALRIRQVSQLRKLCLSLGKAKPSTPPAPPRQ